MGHRKMPAYGEREHGGRYILDEYEWSRNHCKAVTIRRWKRDLKKKARAHNRRVMASGNAGRSRLDGKWGPQKNGNPLPVYCILPLESNDSKENRRHNVHKHLAAVLCIIPNQNEGYEAELQPLLGEPLGIP